MTDSTQSEYLAAREEWDDRFAGQRKMVTFLGITTVLALGIGAMGLGYGIWTGARTQFIPYIVQVDNLGRAEIAAEPQMVGDWPDNVVKRELELFFDRLRTISPDLSIVVKNHSAFEKFLPAGSPAVQKIREYFKNSENDPIKRAARETVAVEMVGVNYVSGSSWQIEWIETTFARQSGREQGAKRFVAIAQIEFRTPKSRELLKNNPLGMFLIDVDIQEVKF